MSKRTRLQNEQIGPNDLAEMETRVDLPTFGSLAPRTPRGESGPRRRRFPWWMRALAVGVSVVVLFGSMVIVLTRPRATAPQATVVSSPTGCQPLAWQLSSPSTTGELDGIVAASPSDAWAVGQTIDQRALIEHWDGRIWRVIASPQLRRKAGSLQAIALVTSTDIWAAGEQHDLLAPGTGVPGVEKGSTTLIEHWDGRTWAIVPGPETGQDPQSVVWVSALTVISAHDIWMVGALANRQANTQTALIEHWDGQQWTHVLDQSPVLENGISARASKLLATTNAGGQVLVGGARIGSDQQYHAYLERWDGHTWQQIDVRSWGQNASAINALSAVSASDIWAIVQRIGRLQTVLTTLAHWDGHTWKQIDVPDGMNPLRLLALSSTSVWAMTLSLSVLLHWDGTSWSQITLPVSPLDLETDFKDFMVSAGAIWVVGTRFGRDRSPFRPLLEQQRTCS